MSKLFLVLLFLFGFQVSKAEGTLPAEKSILHTIAREVKKECETCKVELMIHNKELVNDVALPDLVMADHWRGQTNLALKLGEETRVITATIRWKDNVVVAKRNIRQGHRLSAEDLRVVEKDVTFLKTPYATSAKKVVGLESKRVFQRGHIVDETYLQKPIVVRYGQPIKLELSEGALNVLVVGQAKGAGAIGDRIPVVIADTKKKVFAKIIEKDKARME